MSLRKIYYRLPPKMRLLARKIAFAPLGILPARKYSNGLKTPPRSLIFTGGGDFKETGERFLSYFIKHGLNREDFILDIGSGMGRMALPLTTYLEGTYLGLDIMEQATTWCERNISSKFPNFRFHFLDIRNDLYRNSGKSATSVRLPVNDAEIDFTILISVLTHMLPKEVEHYISEISRSLKKGGICFATFFIYENEEVLANNQFETFYRQDDHHALMDESVKGANVAFKLAYLKKIFTDNGLKINYISKGSWKYVNSNEDFQDFVVLEKK